MKENVCLALRDDIELTSMYSSCLSEVYFTNDHHVIKRFWSKEPEHIFDFFKEMRSQYNLLTKYLGRYVVQTQLFISQDSFNPMVYMYQQYKSGCDLHTATELIKAKQYPAAALIDFYRSAITMYHETRMVPDLFGRPGVTNLYRNMTRTPNVICIYSDGELIPQLVDNQFSNVSKLPIVKHVSNYLLVEKMINELEDLSSDSWRKNRVILKA